MGRRWGWFVAVLVLLSGSAYSGHRVGDGPIGAQATGTSTSGGGGEVPGDVLTTSSTSTSSTTSSTSSTSTSVPPGRVAEGRPAECPKGTDPNRHCFSVDDAAEAEGAAIPDGTGGTTVVAAPDGQLAGDGFSSIWGSNTEVRIEVDSRTGTIVEAEEQGGIRQAVMLTLAGLALLLVGVYAGAKLRRPRQDPQ